MSAMNLEDLALSVRRLEQAEVGMQESARIAQQDLARIAVEMSDTERFLLRKDDMLAALNRLQIKAQEKNKGLFENLLTNLIQEVIPGKKDQVVLTSTLKNNRANLDFDILCNGELENIIKDKGGSIANIVAMGLRFIVLARHPNRRILLLDEADCHLKSEYIPAFAAVMRQLAVKMGIQVLYISHHSATNFVGYGRVIDIYRESGKTHSRVLHEESDEDKAIESMSAFRYIRLRDYGPHENLLVELSPGLNVITGDVDLGKSKVIQAVADLLENNGEERRIRHNRPFFNVEIGLEEGISLSWDYQRKGSKRTRMVLKDAQGQEIETSDSGTGVPEWLDMYLSMPLVSGESIHVHDQKHPHYLLSETEYTSIKRAEMLPLGRESRDVQRMIQLFNSKLASARQDFTRLQKELNQVKNTLAILAPVLDEPMDLDGLHEGMVGIRAMVADHAKLQQSIQRIESLVSISEDMKTLMDDLKAQAPADVALKATPEMRKTIVDLQSASARRDILAELAGIPKAADAPTLKDVEGVKSIGIRLGSLSKISEMMKGLKTLEKAPVIELKASAEMVTTLASLESKTTRRKELVDQLGICKLTAEKVASAKSVLFTKMGGICPTCEKPLEGHNHD